MNRTRWIALLVLIGSGLAVYGFSASPAFGYRHLDIVGASLTPQSTVRSELAVDDGINLFRLSTDGMAQRLRTLPTVAGATIEVALPDTLRVRLVEREAVVIWQVGTRRFLVDGQGVAFADATGTTGLPLIDDRRVRGGGPTVTADEAAASGDPVGASGKLPAASGKLPAASGKLPAASGKLPAASAGPSAATPSGKPAAPPPSGKPPAASPESPAASGDLPAASPEVPLASPAPLATLGIGDTIDPVDFDAATRLGSLRPADVGSGAAGLNVRIDDEHGFSIDTGKNGWAAVFGFYTPTIRRTDLIPGQVRLLKSLLLGREETIATVILAGEREGTFNAKPSP